LTPHQRLCVVRALQKIGNPNAMAEASAAADIPGYLAARCRKGCMQCPVVGNQMNHPTKNPSKPTSSSSAGSFCFAGSFYFIYTYQVEFVMSDVEIKAKLDLRGTPAAKEVFAARAGRQAPSCQLDLLLRGGTGAGLYTARAREQPPPPPRWENLRNLRNLMIMLAWPALSPATGPRPPPPPALELSKGG
jgi:hypothetical protein